MRYSVVALGALVLPAVLCGVLALRWRARIEGMK
jgi:hypothetical protein